MANPTNCKMLFVVNGISIYGAAVTASAPAPTSWRQSHQLLNSLLPPWPSSHSRSCQSWRSLRCHSCICLQPANIRLLARVTRPFTTLWQCSWRTVWNSRPITKVKTPPITRTGPSRSRFRKHNVFCPYPSCWLLQSGQISSKLLTTSCQPLPTYSLGDKGSLI